MSDPHFNGPLAVLLREALQPLPPDPWSKEIDAEVKSQDAIPLCTGCLCPQDSPRWLCLHCGFPSGNYSATMPYIGNFVEGEFFRRGVFGPPEPGFLRHLFLVIYATVTYWFFAPVYWYWMIRKAQGRPICAQFRREYVPADPAAEHPEPAS